MLEVSVDAIRRNVIGQNAFAVKDLLLMEASL